MGVDDASEERTSVFGQIATNVNCSKYDITPGNGGWTFEFVCGGPEMTSTTSGTVAGDFSGSYRVEVTESDGTFDMSRTIEATRLGDCPPGMKPGLLTDESGKQVADITR